MQGESFEREYIVTYHTKSGRHIIETYSDYGTALYAAAVENDE